MQKAYFPFGVSRNSTGNLPTDKLFTGQRLDTTGLYYYGARYYDPSIGRFISADTIVPNPANPQSLNRYSYCLNNPLKYVDPSGFAPEDILGGIGYYQSLCATKGIDPNAGTVLELDGGSNVVGQSSNRPIVDHIVTFTDSFTITNGILPDGSWINKTINIVSAGLSIWSSALGGKSTLSDAASIVIISGNVCVYHTDDGGTGVNLFLSESAPIPVTATLYWTSANQTYSESMYPSDITGPYIATPGIHTIYNVQANYVNNPIMQMIGAPNPYIPNYYDRRLQSMYIALTPRITASSNPASGLPTASPRNIYIPIK